MSDELPVTWKQVAAFRLARHHLRERASAEALVQVAGEIAGAQAQLPSAAQIALWARVRDLQVPQIEEALNKRSLVKAACMRRTLFLVPSKQLAVFVRGSTRRAEKGIRWTLKKGIPEQVVEEAMEATLAVLEEPLTRPEIAERVSRVLDVQPLAIHGGGWGSRGKVAAVSVGHIAFPVVELMHLVGARGVVCYGPARGQEPTFVRADAWIPGWKDLPVEEAEVELLKVYLRAFGPATPRDFSLWSGMTLTEARQIWMNEQPDLVPVSIEGWRAELLREDFDALAGTKASFERPVVRLLPYFDTFLLGHEGRDHLVDGNHRASVFRPQGWIAPVVLVNGQVAGIWGYTLEGKQLQVKVQQFQELPKGVKKGIEAEADGLGRFLGTTKVGVQIG
jgi:hypothetical protein